MYVLIDYIYHTAFRSHQQEIAMISSPDRSKYGACANIVIHIVLYFLPHTRNPFPCFTFIFVDNGEEVDSEDIVEKQAADDGKFQYGPCKEGDKECETYHSRAINRKSLSLVSKITKRII